MNARQRAFVLAYQGNATTAALAAGYSERSAHMQGHRLLKNDEIMSAIQARQDGALAAVVADREERMSFWTRVMRDEGTDPAHRLKASELLGKACGDFLQRVQAEISGPPAPPTIVVSFVSPEDVQGAAEAEEGEARS